MAAAAGPGREGGPAPVNTPLGIPAVRHWDVPDGGVPGWVPGAASRVVLSETDAAVLEPLARRLAAELAEELGAELGARGAGARPPAVVVGAVPAPGDVQLRLGGLAGVPSAEGYALEAGAVLSITAPAPAGLYYGSRTLLQLLRTGFRAAAPGSRPGLRGSTVDWPEFAQRGVMVDIGRKHFTPGWLKSLIRELGWLKLNVLHLHLNDNSGVRLECTSHPGLVSEPHLGRAELLDILAVAREHHVTVIPEFDTPSHARAVLASHPELALRDRHGTIHDDRIDVSLPAARALVAEVVSEWAQLFDGPWFHLGGDEFFAAPWEDPAHQDPWRFPSLAAWASAETGRSCTPQDGYVLYLNQLGRLLAAHGKRARVWNDHVHPGAGGIPLDTDIEVEVWIRWNREQPSAQELLDAGYSLVNRNGDHLYFVLSSEGPPATHGRKSAQGIYDLWHPRRFMGAAGGAADLDLDPAAPVAGAIVSVWCDSPDAMDEDQLRDGLLDWMRSLSQQLWGSPKIAADYADFAPLFPVVGEAPVLGEAPVGAGVSRRPPSSS